MDPRLKDIFSNQNDLYSFLYDFDEKKHNDKRFIAYLALFNNFWLRNTTIRQEIEEIQRNYDKFANKHFSDNGLRVLGLLPSEEKVQYISSLNTCISRMNKMVDDPEKVRIILGQILMAYTRVVLMAKIQYKIPIFPECDIIFMISFILVIDFCLIHNYSSDYYASLTYNLYVHMSSMRLNIINITNPNFEAKYINSSHQKIQNYCPKFTEKIELSKFNTFDFIYPMKLSLFHELYSFTKHLLILDHIVLNHNNIQQFYDFLIISHIQNLDSSNLTPDELFSLFHLNNDNHLERIISDTYNLMHKNDSTMTKYVMIGSFLCSTCYIAFRTIKYFKK